MDGLRFNGILSTQAATKLYKLMQVAKEWSVHFKPSRFRHNHHDHVCGMHYTCLQCI